VHGIFAQPGHKCVSVKDGLPTWVCEIMVTKPTVRLGEGAYFMAIFRSALSFSLGLDLLGNRSPSGCTRPQLSIPWRVCINPMWVPAS